MCFKEKRKNPLSDNKVLLVARVAFVGFVMFMAESKDFFRGVMDCALVMRVKKTALIICNDGKEYWITQKQFWQMVREGVVVQTGDQPLQGKFRGRDDQLLITLNHTVLNHATPIHTGEVLHNARYKKSRR